MPLTASQVQGDSSAWGRILEFAGRRDQTQPAVERFVREQHDVAPQTARAVAGRAMAAVASGRELTSARPDEAIARDQIPLNESLPPTVRYATRIVTVIRDPSTGREARLFSVLQWTGNPTIDEIRNSARLNVDAAQADALLRYNRPRTVSPVIKEVVVLTIERRS